MPKKERRSSFSDLDQADVNAALSRLGLSPERALGVAANITAEEDVAYLFRAIKERFGRWISW